MTTVRKVDILGIGVSVIDMTAMLELIQRAVARNQKLRAAFCNVHTVTDCQSNPHLRAAVNGCQVITPDGMPLVWIGKLRGHGGIKRVYGPDTLLAVCEDGLEAGYRHYFYGSTDEVLERLQERLRERFPGLIIAGTYSPPFRELTPEETAEAIQRINDARPDIVWVGLGMPKQEVWAAANQAQIEAPVILAVGAAFAFHAGTVKQAPRWMQRFGLEWFYRLWQEPTRLWRRYLIGNTKFVYLMARDFLRRRSASPT